MDTIPWASLTTLGPAGLVTLAVILVFFGWLVPRWVMRDVMADRDRWRTIAEVSTAQVTALVRERDEAHAALAAIEQRSRRAEGVP